MSGFGRIIFEYFSHIFRNENRKAKKICYPPQSPEQYEARIENRKYSKESGTYHIRRYHSMPEVGSFKETNASTVSRSLNNYCKYTVPNRFQKEGLDTFKTPEKTNKPTEISRLRNNQESCLESINVIKSKETEKDRRCSCQGETILNFDRNQSLTEQTDSLVGTNVTCCPKNFSKYTLSNEHQCEDFKSFRNQYKETICTKNQQEICLSGSDNVTEERETEKRSRRCSCECETCLNLDDNQSFPQINNIEVTNSIDANCRQKIFSKYTLPNQHLFRGFRNQIKEPTSSRSRQKSYSLDDSGLVCDGSSKTSSEDLFLSHASVYFDAVPWLKPEFECSDDRLLATSNENSLVQQRKDVISEEFGGTLKNDREAGSINIIEGVRGENVKCSGEDKAYLSLKRCQSMPQMGGLTKTIDVNRFRNSFSRYNKNQGEDFGKLHEIEKTTGLLNLRNRKEDYFSEFCFLNVDKSNDRWRSMDFVDSTIKKDVTLKRVHAVDLSMSEMCHSSQETEWRKISSPKYTIFEEQKLCQSRIPAFKTKTCEDETRNITKYRYDSRFGWSSLWNRRQTKSSCLSISIAHRSLLNTNFEKKFPEFTKKIYRGNIMDYVSHSKWMKQAGIYQEENAAGFKRYAQKKVVLTLPEYKEALAKICEDYGLDYWEVLIKMTNVTPRSDIHSFSDESSD
ncbi:uncharacterized protein [Parasteatoda tepidariorum]|uniref:uncharacterized protein n=1 Tax=Parasteatoda tepidariorum TaxID=114398 RepID=UPI00077F98CA|nr:uncharacterized protein LOC107440993 [Parasteatoda tepidariorum]